MDSSQHHIWWKLPLAGNICWCHFPQDQRLGPGPKPRPALIVQVYAGSQEQQFQVRVAYGTSQKTEQLHSGEFRITPEDGEAFALSGLSYPTKFNMKDTVLLPYNSHWFSVPPKPAHGQQPKLGSLHVSLLRRAKAASEA